MDEGPPRILEASENRPPAAGRKRAAWSFPLDKGDFILTGALALIFYGVAGHWSEYVACMTLGGLLLFLVVISR